MKVEVFIERENAKKTVELDGNTKVIDLLKTLNINPVSVIVSKNGEVVIEDTLIKDKDKIDIYSVVSGG